MEEQQILAWKRIDSDVVILERDFYIVIRSVVIGANVRVLPNGVFQHAKNLVKVEFEERNEEQKLSLGEYTFACCDNLIKIDLPLGTDSIGEYAFMENFALENVNTVIFYQDLQMM